MKITLKLKDLPGVEHILSSDPDLNPVQIDDHGNLFILGKNRTTYVYKNWISYTVE